MVSISEKELDDLIIKHAKIAVQESYDDVRNEVLDQVVKKLASKAVKIEGTPYSCGPRKWCLWVDEMKDDNAKPEKQGNSS